MDDSKSYSFFRKVERLVHAPKSVEHFYLTLGCQTISSIVEEHYGSVGDGKAIAGHPRCTTTREYVLDRLRIFIADSHNSNWDKLYQDYCAGHNFQVQVFEKMRVLRVLKFRGKEERHTCDTTSGYSLDEKNRFILSVITGELDYYECALRIFGFFRLSLTFSTVWQTVSPKSSIQRVEPPLQLLLQQFTTRNFMF